MSWSRVWAVPYKESGGKAGHDSRKLTDTMVSIEGKMNPDCE